MPLLQAFQTPGCLMRWYPYSWVWFLLANTSATFTSSPWIRKSSKRNHTLLYDSWYTSPSHILRASIQTPSAYFIIFSQTAKPPWSAILSVFYLFYSLDSFSLFQEIYKHIISRVAVNWKSLLQLGSHPLPSVRLREVILVLSSVQRIVKLWMHF